MGVKDVGQKIKNFFGNLFKKKEKGESEPTDKAPKWFRWGTIISIWGAALFPLLFIGWEKRSTLRLFQGPISWQAWDHR